jgi:hypothetical protein
MAKTFFSALWECLSEGRRSYSAMIGFVIAIAAFAKEYGFSLPFPASVYWMGASASLAFAYFKAVWKLHRERDAKKKPDIVLLEPRHHYSLIWDAPRSLQIITEPKLANGEGRPLGTRRPVFRLKNIGDASARNIRLSWTIDQHFSLETIVKNSRRMVKHNYVVKSNSAHSTRGDDNSIVRIVATQKTSGESKLPYLVPQLDQESSVPIEIPSELYEAVEIYFAAVLPDDRPYQNAELTCTVRIDCAGSPNYQTQKYRVNIVAHDRNSAMPREAEIPVSLLQEMGLKPKPALGAEVRFSVEAIA